jgi:uncharacterized iron-regulated protein
MKNLACTHHIQDILLVHERKVLYVSGTYHSTSTGGYQLRIAHLVIKVIHLQQGNVQKGTTMQPITSSSFKDPIRSAQATHA